MPVWNLTPNQTSQLLSGDNQATTGIPVIDLRDYSEFITGHIVGALCNKPGSQNWSEVLDNRNTRGLVLLYGGSQYPEDEISRLESQGIKGVFVLEGGITAWTRAGKVVVTGG